MLDDNNKETICIKNMGQYTDKNRDSFYNYELESQANEFKYMFSLPF